MILITISTFILALQSVKRANILYLSPVTSPSHHIWNSALINGIAARGHNVTVLSPDIDKIAPKGVHYIQMEGLYSGTPYKEFLNSIFNFSGEFNPLSEPHNWNEFWYAICQSALKTKGFQSLLDYPDDFRFDLIVNDFTLGGCLLGFVHKFNNPPLISVTPFNHPTYLKNFIGGHHYYSYIPHVFLHYNGDMNIFQRMYNFIVHLIESFCHTEIFDRKLNKLVEEAFGPGFPSITEIGRGTALAFINTNPAFDYMAPLPENVIPVGGLQIKATNNPLPKDLKKFIVSAKKGAVLFSLGSNIRSSYLNTDKQKIILDAFKKFPDYHFLWKFEEPSTDLELPKNVIIRPWLPQSDILAHSNIKAFITHAGLLSTHEAIWYGVPLIGIPFGYDQNVNIIKAIKNGFAEEIKFTTMTTEIIKDKLQKVLENRSYYQNAKKVSARFRDQKEKPLDRAVWWIEWLLRNPDCEYLKSPVLRLGFIVGNSFDIIAIISIFSFLIVIFIIKTCLPAPQKLVLYTENKENHNKKSQ